MPKPDGSMDRHEAQNVLAQRDSALSEVEELKSKLKEANDRLQAVETEYTTELNKLKAERDAAVRKFDEQTTLITQGLMAVQTLMNALGGEEKVKQLRRDQLRKAKEQIDAELSTLPGE